MEDASPIKYGRGNINTNASLRRPRSFSKWCEEESERKRERERSIPLTNVHKFHSRREVINVITSEKLKGMARLHPLFRTPGNRSNIPGPQEIKDTNRFFRVQIKPRRMIEGYCGGDAAVA